MTLVYLHGAASTSRCFNYIRSNIKHNHVELLIDIKGGRDHREITKTILTVLNQNKINDAFFICHSAGGMWALQIANLYPARVRGAVTLATPYRSAVLGQDFGRFFKTWYNLQHRVLGKSSELFTPIEQMKVLHPWTNIVATGGRCSYFFEPNDGGVTVSQQRAKTEMTFQEIDATHYDILIKPKVAKIVQGCIEQALP